MSHLSTLKLFVSFPYVDCGEDCMCIGINIESGGNNGGYNGNAITNITRKNLKAIEKTSWF
jgi:hypothetical protein